MRTGLQRGQAGLERGGVEGGSAGVELAHKGALCLQFLQQRPQVARGACAHCRMHAQVSERGRGSNWWVTRKHHLHDEYILKSQEQQ